MQKNPGTVEGREQEGEIGRRLHAPKSRGRRGSGISVGCPRRAVISNELDVLIEKHCSSDPCEQNKSSVSSEKDQGKNCNGVHR